MSDFSRRHFYNTRLLRPFSIFRGATHFPLSESWCPVGQQYKETEVTLYSFHGLSLAFPRSMMQSNEKLSSHQSLAPNVAAMYALSGKQTTPAPGRKIVKRDDDAIGKVNVENVQSCTQCESCGFEHQRAKQQEQNSPWNLEHLGPAIHNLFETADTFSKAYQKIRPEILASNPRFSRHLRKPPNKLDGQADRLLFMVHRTVELDCLLKLLESMPSNPGLQALSPFHLKDIQHRRWLYVGRRTGSAHSIKVYSK